MAFLMIKEHNMANAKEITNRMRRNIVRMIYEAKSGHPGGSLSIVEILYTLYFEIMDMMTY